MNKICLATVGVVIAPLFIWSMAPILLFLAAVAPFVLLLAAAIIVGTRPRSGIDVLVASATPCRFEPTQVSERPLQQSLVSWPFLDRAPSNNVSFAALEEHE
jgi:hypothetical protein